MKFTFTWESCILSGFFQGFFFFFKVITLPSLASQQAQTSVPTPYTSTLSFLFNRTSLEFQCPNELSSSSCHISQNSTAKTDTIFEASVFSLNLQHLPFSNYSQLEWITIFKHYNSNTFVFYKSTQD